MCMRVWCSEGVIMSVEVGDEVGQVVVRSGGSRRAPEGQQEAPNDRAQVCIRCARVQLDHSALGVSHSTPT